jgi:transcriptional regulator GlxA family with amidase domain
MVLAIPKGMERCEAARPFIFLLLDGFSMLSLSCCAETMRVANRIAGSETFRWSFMSETGEPVRSSLGVPFPVDRGLANLDGGETVLVCGGDNIKHASTRVIIDWLRRQAVHGVPVGGLCTATYTLAKAGLLNGKRATIHWENETSFAEEFPQVILSHSPYVIDGHRYSTAGGTSSVDLVLSFVEDMHGPALAGEIAEQLIYSSIRKIQETASTSLPGRMALRHPRLSAVIRLMEERLEDPVPTPKLAEAAGISPRHLERLFQRHIGRTPLKYYMDLRLARARHLLQQTDMTSSEIGLACGFLSASHFSKCYRFKYRQAPLRARGL